MLPKITFARQWPFHFVPLAISRSRTRFGLAFGTVRVCVMAPPSLWSGNLRLSLVLIPVRLIPAISTEEAISLRQIHEPSATPIRQVKGVREATPLPKCPMRKSSKATSMSKDSTSLSIQKRSMTLSSKPSIPSTFGSSWRRKKSTPAIGRSHGDEADEGYAIMQRTLAETGKVAIGQLIMGGRAHLLGIRALGNGLMLSILRYADELRDFTPYFEGINFEPKS